MAGNWYLGGIQKMEFNANEWVTGSLNASLVAGTALAANSLSWKTISEFQGGGNSFVTGGTVVPDAALPAGKAAFWNDGTDEFRCTWPAGKISFGSPTAGQDFCGVLIHDGTVAGGGTVWAYQRITGDTKGGVVEWGSATQQNEVLTASPKTVPDADTGVGYIQNIFNTRTDSWGSGSDSYQFSLVQSLPAGGFDRDWSDLGEALGGGLTFCTNAGYDDQVPTLLGLNRSSQVFNGGVGEYYLPTNIIAGGLSWPGIGLTQGQPCVGILGYINVGSQNTSPIFMFNAVNPSITLNNGQDVFWDSFDTAGRVLMQLNAVVS